MAGQREYSRELVIYTDESSKNGKFFANFYGGALIRSNDLARVIERLSTAAADAGFHSEVKWSKVSKTYLQKYIALIDAFFDLVAADLVKVRIMFTQTRYVATNLTPYHRENQYHLLYYQFFKHAFGLRYSNPGPHEVRLRINMDQLPDVSDKNASFKGYLAGLEHSVEFKAAKIHIPADQIAEVRSHDHIVLQCLDVVLGSMQFRLNDLHKGKAEGAVRRGAKTIAKESLYKHINKRIREIYPNFNIGISTGTLQPSDHWTQPYRHWLFVPAENRVDNALTKKK